MYTPEHSIISRGVGTREQWIAAIAPHGAANVEATVEWYLAIAPTYGLNHDLALAQACVECSYFTDWKWTNRWNPAGMGSTTRAEAGNAFGNYHLGIVAQYEHLCCYVYSKSTCPADHANLSDQRHFFHDGMPRVGDLVRLPARAWANPGTHYAQSICDVANAVAGSSDDSGTGSDDKGGTPMIGLDDLGIIDIRDRMAKAPGQGAGYKSAKSGVIIHYNGPPTHDPALPRFISDANFHIGPYLREYTIAYIYGIGDEPDDGGDAPIYLMRDPDDVCWHCGSWPENATYTPIAFTFGEGQSAGPGQLRAARKLIDALRDRDGFGRDAVKGHKEVDSTACPGTLMDDLIYPYRAGEDMPMSDYVTFSQTKHGVGGGFRAFFEHHGGVPIIGMPISEEMPDPLGGKLPDGSVMTVQYFERARMEYHPEFSAPNDVLLTRFGAIAAKQAGLKGPGIDG